MDRLDLQREILEALASEDEAALERLAAREGVDPALWRYARSLLREVAEIEASRS